MTERLINPYCAALNSLRTKPKHKLKEIGDQWRTPNKLWWGINTLYGPLVLDLFADRDNAKCEDFYSAEDNALVQNWSARLAELGGAAYANPPYSRASKHDGAYITGMRHIITHTMAMREAGGRYVFLIKAATGEAWWPEEADHIAFIRGRISFDLPEWYCPEEGQPAESSAGFGAAIAVFDKNWHGPKFDYVTRDELEARGSAFMAQIEKAARKLISDASEPLSAEEAPAIDESELPLSKELIITQSGYDVWACAVAAFGDLSSFSFSQSKFAHTWAADSVTNPQFAAVPIDTVASAVRIIQAQADVDLLKKWIQANVEPFSQDEMTERLQSVYDEYNISMNDFIRFIEQFDRSNLNNIRVLRASISNIISL